MDSVLVGLRSVGRVNNDHVRVGQKHKYEFSSSQDHYKHIKQICLVSHIASAPHSDKLNDHLDHKNKVEG